MLRRVVDEIVASRILGIIALWLLVFLLSALMYSLYAFYDEIEDFFILKDPIDFRAIALVAPITMSFVLLAVCAYVVSSVIKGKVKGYLGVINPILVAFGAFIMSIAFYFNHSEVKFGHIDNKKGVVAIR